MSASGLHVAVAVRFCLTVSGEMVVSPCVIRSAVPDSENRGGGELK